MVDIMRAKARRLSQVRSIQNWAILDGYGRLAPGPLCYADIRTSHELRIRYHSCKTLAPRLRLAACKKEDASAGTDSAVW